MFRVLAAAVIAVAVFIFLCNIWIILSSFGRVYDNPAAIPANKVAVVLGTSKYVKTGVLNKHFQNRIAAAAELYRKNKIRHIIVSGDNAERWHDEPTDMKNALIDEYGIPEKDITRDYAGFRTLDSIVRAKKIFGQNKFTIVSDGFHNYRAVFLGTNHGMDVLAYSSQDVPLRQSYKAKLREIIARVKAILDIYILKTEPAVLGAPVELQMQ